MKSLAVIYEAIYCVGRVRSAGHADIKCKASGDELRAAAPLISAHPPFHSPLDLHFQKWLKS